MSLELSLAAFVGFSLAFVISFIRERRSLVNVIFLGLAILFSSKACYKALKIGLDYDRRLAYIDLIPLLLMGLLAYYFIKLSIKTIRGQGLRMIAILPLLFALGIVATLVSTIGSDFLSLDRDLDFFLDIIEHLGKYTVFSFLCLLFYSMVYRLLPKRTRADFILVHGAGLDGKEPSPLLKGRLDKALGIFRRNQKARIVVSGGQGRDEQISEAEAMKNYLVERGLARDQVVMEDESVSTRENLIFSKQIMDSLEDDYSAVFVTSDYHVLRTSVYAKEVGFEIDGVGSRTPASYFIPAFIREYIALMVAFLPLNAMLLLAYFALHYFNIL